MATAIRSTHGEPGDEYSFPVSARDAVLEMLTASGWATADEIAAKLGTSYTPAQLGAAVWELRAEGFVGFVCDKIVAR